MTAERVATLDRTVRGGFIAEVVFEQRLKANEKRSHVEMEKRILDREKNTQPKTGAYLEV